VTRHLRAAAAASMTLAVVLAVAGVLVGATGADALPQRVPVTFSFDGLLPGEHRTLTRTTTIDRDARVAEARVEASGTGVTWGAELCRGRACVDLLTTRPGTPVPAGTYRLVVSVTAGRIAPGARATLDGRLSLVENDDLAFTGGDGDDDEDDDEDGDPAAEAAGGRPDATGPDGGLALTGARPVGLAALAAGLAAAGALLVAVARRRRDDDAHDHEESAW